ncbi:MAG: hypothetical protein V1725_05485 [archaeon]
MKTVLFALCIASVAAATEPIDPLGETMNYPIDTLVVDSFHELPYLQSFPYEPKTIMTIQEYLEQQNIHLEQGINSCTVYKAALAWAKAHSREYRIITTDGKEHLLENLAIQPATMNYLPGGIRQLATDGTISKWNVDHVYDCILDSLKKAKE